MNLESYFFEWPFSVVPNSEQAEVWADREEVRQQLEDLLTSFEYRPQSTVDLAWAAFGAGKTHLMYHIAHRASQTEGLVPAYTVVPEGVKSFEEVYRVLMADFPLNALKDGGLEDLDDDHPIYRAVYALLVGNDKQRQIAENWLRGRRVDMRSAPKHVKLPYKLETAEQMQNVFQGLIEALVGSGKRVIVLLDEYTRVRTHSGRASGKLNNLLLDTFNAIPKGLSFIVSVSATQRSTAYDVLPEELVDRMRGRAPLVLPELTVADAIIFSEDLFAARRPEGFDGESLSPFSRPAVKTVASYLEDSCEFKLIPRHLIQILDLSLQKGVREDISEIDETVALRAIEQMENDRK